MKIYSLMPVHNRLAETKEVLSCLRAQSFCEPDVVVVDDGSVDGTAEYIRKYAPHVKLIQGDGSLWWGGAMARGLEYILMNAEGTGYVLFLNNDVRFFSDLITELVAAAHDHKRSVVGSVLMDIDRPDRIISIGPRIRYGLARIEEVYDPGLGRPVVSGVDRYLMARAIEVDGLSGRGTLYPLDLLRKIGNIRWRWLPHYLADYELSVRAREAGYSTLVATRAIVWSAAKDSGIDPHRAGVVERLFSRRSRSNILDAVAFFSLCGPWYHRLTAPVRVPALRLWGVLRRRYWPPTHSR